MLTVTPPPPPPPPLAPNSRTPQGSPHLSRSEKSDINQEPEYDSDEDSLQASPASVRWTARPADSDSDHSV